jgi:penicillin-binding protein 2
MHEPNLADGSGRLVETRQGYDPRVVFFYFAIGGLLAILATGLAYQQLIKTGDYYRRERQQNERRIILPGPRGNIYDRYGRLLVGNRPRYSVVLYLDELQSEFRREFIRIHQNYRRTGDPDQPSAAQMEQIAQVTVVQQYLDRVDAILHRRDQVDVPALKRQFARQLLLPYTLVADLTPEEFARLVEHLPGNSPLQLYASSSRTYPYGALAAHVLGFVGVTDDLDAEDVPADDLTTFRMKGTTGRDGLEKTFDSTLQGKAGERIVRVDPAGYTVNQPVGEPVRPVPGKDLVTSLDADLQEVAERTIGDRTGAAVALDVRTGEVLVLASEPGYDLNAFSPRLSAAAAADIEARKAWADLAISGLFPPGSTFKTIVTMAGLRSGRLDPNDTDVDCEGEIRIGNRMFKCDNGNGHHGRLDLPNAIAQSCDIYFYEHGLAIGPDLIAAEARRFRLDRPTGIELPNESRGMIIPDRTWKMRRTGEAWTDGDTANMSIGQGFILETPIAMACYAASLARDEVSTVPTLVHDPDRPPQHSDPIGLPPAQRAVLLEGMERCTQAGGTAEPLSTVPALEIPGVRIAGKTGTAQIPGHLDVAWFICFAPIEHPRIAVAVAIEGDTPGENYGGGLNAAPVAALILKAYFAKQAGITPGSPASARTAGSPSPGSLARDP